MDFDIAIVGAGPAGATCLLALAGKGLRVLVIEKAAFPREKACGDAVPGLALKVWEELSPALVEELHKLPSALPLAEGFVCGPYGGRCRITFVKPGLVVRRSEMDAALFNFAKTATVCTYVTFALKRLTHLRDGFMLEMANGQRFTTRRLAAADGATGPCRKLLTGQAWLADEVSVAVRSYMPCPAQAGAGRESLALWFDKGVMPGYLWAFPLADGTLNVGAGILGGSGERRAAGLKSLLANWAGKPSPKDERPIGVLDVTAWLGQKLPLGMPGRPSSGPGFLLLGDAAGLVAPATGDGIGQAAFSGKLAAEAMAASLEMTDMEAAKSFFLDHYDKPLYARLGASFVAQRRMVRIGQQAPWLLEGLIRLAARSAFIRKRLASL